MFCLLVLRMARHVLGKGSLSCNEQTTIWPPKNQTTLGVVSVFWGHWLLFTHRGGGGCVLWETPNVHCKCHSSLTFAFLRIWHGEGSLQFSPMLQTFLQCRNKAFPAPSCAPLAKRIHCSPCSPCQSPLGLLQGWIWR